LRLLEAKNFAKSLLVKKNFPLLKYIILGPESSGQVLEVELVPAIPKTKSSSSLKYPWQPPQLGQINRKHVFSSENLQSRKFFEAE
jgi:hypothetical protein